MKRVVLAIDPGLRGTGVALLEDGEVVAAGYARPPVVVGVVTGRAHQAAVAARAVAEWAAGRGVTEVVVEWPQTYARAIRGGTSKADPNDLLGLAGVGAAIAALYAGLATTSYLPAEWKGQVPKEVMHRRVESRLRLSELAYVRAAVEAANARGKVDVWDAVGIGLHHVGRLGKKETVK